MAFNRPPLIQVLAVRRSMKAIPTPRVSGSQFAVGRPGRGGNRLAGVDADLALKQDEVLS